MKDRRKYVCKKKSMKEKNRIRPLRTTINSWTNKRRSAPKNGLIGKPEFKLRWDAWQIQLENKTKKKRNKMTYAFCNMHRKEIGNN